MLSVCCNFYATLISENRNWESIATIENSPLTNIQLHRQSTMFLANVARSIVELARGTRRSGAFGIETYPPSVSEFPPCVNKAFPVNNECSAASIGPVSLYGPGFLPYKSIQKTLLKATPIEVVKKYYSLTN